MSYNNKGYDPYNAAEAGGYSGGYAGGSGVRGGGRGGAFNSYEDARSYPRGGRGRQDRYDDRDYSRSYDREPRRDDYYPRGGDHYPQDYDRGGDYSRDYSYNGGESSSHHHHHHHHSHESGRPPRPPVKPEPPSASVVLLGLPENCDDARLRTFLEDLGASIDSTTVIRDRVTNVSKRYGFAKFSSVEHARSFVEPNFPVVTWIGGPEEGMKIKINYSQKTGGWREDQGSTSRVVEQGRDSNHRDGFHLNDGTRDVGSQPSQILLLRGLDPLTSEEDIVEALKGMNGRPGKEVQEGRGVKKILLVRDRYSKSSWGYAFVQFADVRLATEVLGSAFNPSQYPSGFRIRSSIIAFSFTHENSFIPIYARSDFSFREGGQELVYWDEKGFVSTWVPPTSSSTSTSTSTSQAKEGRKVEEKSAEEDMEAFFQSLEAEVGPVKPVGEEEEGPKPLVMAPGSTLGISIKMKPVGGASPSTGSDDKGKAGPKLIKINASLPASTVDASTSGLAKKTPSGDLIVSRKAAKDISKWNVKQAELAVPVPPDPTLPAGMPVGLSAVNTTLPAKRDREEPVVSGFGSGSHTKQEIGTTTTTNVMEKTITILDVDYEYADPRTLICLLCQRQFKGIPELDKHNKLSALHKTNLGNEKTLEEAKQRKLKANQRNSTSASMTPTPTSTDTPKYVDRAAARRAAHNQPEVPEPKRRKFEPAPLATPSIVEKEPVRDINKDGLEESNVGAKMLEKMGWAKGTGLGSSGAGIVDPIQAAQFQQGAGLGAAKGVAVGSEFAHSSKDYKELMREKARQRLERDGS